jgi:hypothetical protein
MFCRQAMSHLVSAAHAERHADTDDQYSGCAAVGEQFMCMQPQ